MNHSNKDSNRLIVYENVEHADDTVVCFGNNIFVLKIENNAWEFNRFFIIEKKKHLGSGMSTQEVGETKRCGRVFLPTLLSCFSRFLRALQQNRAQLRPLFL